MDREIKFRAWDGERMHYNILEWEMEDGFKETLKKNNIKSVIQYTGLSDKNGVDIYEGDFPPIIT